MNKNLYTPILPAASPEAATFIIEQTFAEGRQDQYLRELFVNELQAGATEVRNTAKRLSAFGATGGVKRAIVGNGEGMGRDKIADFVGSLFAGKSKIGVDGNFQTGGRAATVPLNPLGMLVASWVEGDLVGSVVHLAQDPETGLYVKVRFENEDGTLTEVGEPDPELHHPLIQERGQGTVVILLGEKPEDHTVGKVERRADGKLIYPSQRGAQVDRLYLNAKFFALPSNVTLKSMWGNNDMKQWKKDIAPGEWFEDAVERTQAQPKDTGHKYSFRSIQGVQNRIEKYTNPAEIDGVDHGTVTVRSKRGYPATIHWALFAESKYERYTEQGGGKSDTTDYGVPLGLFGELLEDEKYKFSEVYNVSTFGETRTPMEWYGISRRELRDRLVLIVEPGKANAKFMGAVASGSRSHLLVANAPLPHAEWGDDFSSKMPQAIKDRIAELNGKLDGERAARNQKLRNRLTGWFQKRTKADTIAAPETGDTVEGDGGAGGTGGDLPAEEVNKGAGTPCPDGCTCGKHHPGPKVNKRPPTGSIGGTGFKVDHDATTSNNTVKLPLVLWVGNKEFQGMEAMLVHQADANTIHINGDHKHLMNIINVEVVSRPKSKAQDVPWIVKDAIVDHLLSYVMSARLYGRSALVPVGTGVDPDFAKAAMTNEALSASLLNLVTVEAIISNAFRGRTGFARVTGEEDEAA